METNDINFISVSGKKSGYEKAKQKYPNSVIFYQSLDTWIIYAGGYEYKFGNSPEFLKTSNLITQTKASLDEIRLMCITYADIDQTVSNGASLKVVNNKLKVNLDLATTASAGALSKEDKLKLESFDWLNI